MMENLDSRGPERVRDLRVKRDMVGLSLSWTVPERCDEAILVIGTERPPRHPDDGYRPPLEGAGQYLDVGPPPGSTRHYAVFSKYQDRILEQPVARSIVVPEPVSDIRFKAGLDKVEIAWKQPRGSRRVWVFRKAEVAPSVDLSDGEPQSDADWVAQSSTGDCQDPELHAGVEQCYKFVADYGEGLFSAAKSERWTPPEAADRDVSQVPPAEESDFEDVPIGAVWERDAAKPSPASSFADTDTAAPSAEAAAPEPTVLFRLTKSSVLIRVAGGGPGAVKVWRESLEGLSGMLSEREPGLFEDRDTHPGQIHSYRVEARTAGERGSRERSTTRFYSTYYRRPSPLLESFSVDSDADGVRVAWRAGGTPAAEEGVWISATVPEVEIGEAIEKGLLEEVLCKAGIGDGSVRFRHEGRLERLHLHRVRGNWATYVASQELERLPAIEARSVRVFGGGNEWCQLCWRWPSPDCGEVVAMWSETPGEADPENHPRERTEWIDRAQFEQSEGGVLINVGERRRRIYFTLRAGYRIPRGLRWSSATTADGVAGRGPQVRWWISRGPVLGPAVVVDCKLDEGARQLVRRLRLVNRRQDDLGLDEMIKKDEKEVGGKSSLSLTDHRGPAKGWECHVIAETHDPAQREMVEVVGPVRR